MKSRFLYIKSMIFLKIRSAKLWTYSAVCREKQQLFNTLHFLYKPPYKSGSCFSFIMNFLKHFTHLQAYIYEKHIINF